MFAALITLLGNYQTHKHADVAAWLAKHPRFHLLTPTSSSWLKLVERWFRDLTRNALRRGVFHSVPDLIAAIVRRSQGAQRYAGGAYNTQPSGQWHGTTNWAKDSGASRG